MKLLTDKYLAEFKNNVGSLEKAFENLKQETKEISFDFMIEASAVYSSNIEGNPIDLNSWMNSKQQKEKGRPKSFQEIQDLIDAYNFARTRPLTERAMLEAHGMLSQQFLIANKQGKYRNEPVAIYSSRGLVYVAVEEEYVQQEMTKLFDDVEELSSQKLSLEEVFYDASMIHLRFAQIHPFADGNGRISRLLEKMFLASRIGEIAWKFSSEKYYWDNRPTYYQNINLGVNYYELNYNKCLSFLLMLPSAVALKFSKDLEVR